MKKIITISREFGAGGGEIGQRVAAELGYDFIDKDLILETARSANVEIEKILNLDEKVPVKFGFTQSLFDLYNSPLDEKIFQVQHDVIKKFGEHGRCVIVGRNANSILAEYDDSLHVFIHADQNWRMRRMKQEKMLDCTESQVLAHLKDIDKMRRKYCSYYTHTEFGAPQYYDLSLCTSSLGIEKCVELICSIAK